MADAAHAQREIEARYEALKAKAFVDAPEVTVAELQAMQPPPVLCDVRTPAEWAVSTLPGALRREELELDLEPYRGADAPAVVCFCTIGARSGAAALALRARGVNALNLRGSLLAWTHAGGQLVEPATGQPTRRVHTYSAEWALQAPGYEAVAFERPPLVRGLLALARDKARAWLGGPPRR